jgi:hypothetical protein
MSGLPRPLQGAIATGAGSAGGGGGPHIHTPGGGGKLQHDPLLLFPSRSGAL